MNAPEARFRIPYVPEEPQSEASRDPLIIEQYNELLESIEAPIAKLLKRAQDLAYAAGMAAAAPAGTAIISVHELNRLRICDQMIDHLAGACTYLEDGRAGNTVNPGDYWMADDTDRPGMTLREYLEIRITGAHVPEKVEAPEEEDTICGTCNGSGMGQYEGGICHCCGGSGS